VDEQAESRVEQKSERGVPDREHNDARIGRRVEKLYGRYAPREGACVGRHVYQHDMVVQWRELEGRDVGG
jgi:hypothetical protein